VITPEQKKAYEKFMEAGRELYLVLGISAREKDIAYEELKGEDVTDWVDDDIFLASYIYQEREVTESLDNSVPE
jgi:hypothetical protein